MNTPHNIFRISPLAIATMLALSSCERRDLWVYGDQFKQVEIDVDWRNYDRNPQLYPHTPDPGGMTLWFFPRDGCTSYYYTTSEVRQYETYLSQGNYDALVIDYSPSEYGHQEFVGMEHAQTAKAQSTPSAYQPDSLPELYGPPCYAQPLPTNPNGLYTVSWQPEKMASDTLSNIHISTGRYDNYIPYQERDNYQSSLVLQHYDMKPAMIPWTIRVRIYIKGIYYLYMTQASIAGLADGYYLVQQQASDMPCLMALDDWEVHFTGDNVGYIAKSFLTWGIQNQRNPDTAEARISSSPTNRPAAQIRLNFRFLLRDRKTVRYYHFDVGNLIEAFNNDYTLRIDLGDDFEGMPDLPFVEAYSGMGFDGVVVPWEEGGSSEVGF